MRRWLVAAAGLLLIFGVGAVQVAAPVGAAELEGAGIGGLCGTASLGVMPSDLRSGASLSGAVQVFYERNIVYTTTPVVVPVDVNAVGTYARPSDLPSPRPTVSSNQDGLVSGIASFLLHWDPHGVSAPVRRTVTVELTAPVVGVQLLGATLGDAASSQMHAHGTLYPASVDGLHLAADGSGDVIRIFNDGWGTEVSVRFTAGPAVQEVRIITSLDGFNPYFLRPGPPAGTGRIAVSGDGGVFPFSPDAFQGSLGAQHLNQPIVGGDRFCSGRGYWLVARDGGVFSFGAFGRSPFYGSLGGTPSASPIVAIAATPTGQGYYLASASGAVSAFGDGVFRGDARALHLNKPIVGIAPTPTGGGYWLVASDGGIFAFGDAQFSGSTGALHLNKPIVGMRATLDGNGYYLYASDGGIFSFGDASFLGSAGASGDPNPFVGMRLTVDGNGYWLADTTGRMYGYGPSAPSGPGVSGIHLASPIINMF